MRTKIQIDVLSHNTMTFADRDTGESNTIHQAEVMLFLPKEEYPLKIVVTKNQLADLPPKGKGQAILVISTKKDKLVCAVDFDSAE